MSELDDIRSRRAAITTGEWFPVSLAHIVGVLSSETGQPVATIDGGPRMNADATFIAAAPADIDTLLAHVAALTAERDALAQQLQQAQDAANVAWQEEHAARLVLEERLKAAEQRETALQEMIADYIRAGSNHA